MVRICYLKKYRRPKKGVGYEPLRSSFTPAPFTGAPSVTELFGDVATRVVLISYVRRVPTKEFVF